MKSAIGTAVFSVLIVGACLATPLSAGLVYSNVTGTNVSFVDMTETTTGSGPIFGQPNAVGDSIFAPGTGLLTQSTGGGISLVDGRLQLTIDAAPGFEFNQIDVEQLGSYFGFGAGATSMFSSMAIVESDGNSYNGSSMMSFSGPGQGSFGSSYSISFPSTDSIQLTFNDQLLAASGLTDSAYIDVSSVRISVNAFASAIPEPSSLSVLLLASLAMIRVRRRIDC